MTGIVGLLLLSFLYWGFLAPPRDEGGNSQPRKEQEHHGPGEHRLVRRGERDKHKHLLEKESEWNLTLTPLYTSCHWFVKPQSYPIQHDTETTPAFHPW